MPTNLPLRNPYTTLLLTFTLWKLLLLALIYTTPSPPYDTSTHLIFPPATTPLHHLCQKFARWDALYFVKAAQRGYANEQEWAFGWGFVAAVSLVTKLLPKTLAEPYAQALAAIALSNVAHLLSVLVLYDLTLRVYYSPAKALVAAILHVLSPAGVFLSAPYSESLFSLLGFIGVYLYSVTGWTCGAAVVFCAGALVRSNGVLNGGVFLWDFVREMRAGRVGRVVVLGVGGVVVGMGVVAPQVVAWKVYCDGGDEVRSWCAGVVPSVYLFVQDHYWNVGLFRYWTVSNIPLFLLAAPALAVLIASGVWALKSEREVVQKLAMPQLLLAGLAVSTYHVQIITRLSSGCVVWYWWVAGMICDGDGTGWGRWIVRWMVVYAVVQAVLFAGFLPPA